MKIKMLGTGSMISKSNPASYLVNDKILIDVPNGIVKILKHIDNLNDIEYVFITHIHGDHYFDLPFLFLHFFKEDKPLNVYVHRKWRKKIKKLVKLAFPRDFYNIFYNSKITFLDNDEVVIDEIKIKSFKVVHGKMKPCFGYTFEENDKTLTFTGDASLCESVIEKAMESNLLISDSTLVKGNNKHFGVDNIKYLLEKCEKTLIIPSHMGVNAKEKIKEIKNERLILKEDMEDIIL